MKFSLGGAISGFAKRGLQYNDEQRKLTNDAIVKAVGVAAADTMEQHKARRALKQEYKDGAANLKGMGLSDAQIEQAYLSQGNKAYENLRSKLDAEQVAFKVQQQKDGKDGTWTKDMTEIWLESQFTGLKGVQGRDIEAQSQAYVDYKMPMQAANMGALASGIAASSGEITFESPEAKQARIQKQMSGMMGAETGGANVDSAPATFGFEGASLNMQPSAADVRQARMDDAALTTAEGQATIVEAEAASAEEMVKAKLSAANIGNDISTEQLKAIKEQNPLKLDILKSEKGSAAARAIIDAAKAGNAKATAQLEFAILELQVEAQDISNRTGLQNLAQNKEKFGYTMDLLGLQIEAQDLANQMKTIDANNYQDMANLTLTLKELQVEGENLRNIAQVDANSLHELNKEKLEKSIELIDASIADKQNPATFQAHILQTQTAIDALDPTDPEYDAKLKRLEASQSATIAQLEMYTAATTKATGDKTSYSSLVNSYNKTLEAKLVRAGFTDKSLYMDPNSPGSIVWKGEAEGQAAFNRIVGLHQAQFYNAIKGYNNGAEALNALDIQEPELVPMVERYDEFGDVAGIGTDVDGSKLVAGQPYVAADKNGDPMFVFAQQTETGIKLVDEAGKILEN